MSSPQFGPPGPNGHKGTTIIIAALIALIVAVAVAGVLNMGSY